MFFGIKSTHGTVTVINGSRCKHYHTMEKWWKRKMRKLLCLLDTTVCCKTCSAVFLCFHPCIVSLLFSGPSLHVVNFYQNFFAPSLQCFLCCSVVNLLQYTSTCVLAKFVKKCGSTFNCFTVSVHLSVAPIVIGRTPQCVRVGRFKDCNSS